MNVRPRTGGSQWRKILLACEVAEVLRAAGIKATKARTGLYGRVLGIVFEAARVRRTDFFPFIAGGLRLLRIRDEDQQRFSERVEARPR